MPSELIRKEAQAQQVQQQNAASGARDVETREHHAKASASVCEFQVPFAQYLQIIITSITNSLISSSPSFTLTLNNPALPIPPHSPLYTHHPSTSAKPSPSYTLEHFWCKEGYY